MNQLGFRKMLAKRQEEAKTLGCVGLDPLAEKLPPSVLGYDLATKIQNWMQDIAAATAKFASMFKPQSAHWEAIDGGMDALKNVISFIHKNFPDIPVFLDCKRGDIARTQQQYRIACLDNLGADGMNFSPYMGEECMSALVDKDNPGKSLVSLCYTSNPGGRRLQDALMADGRPVWEHVAEWTLEDAEKFGVAEDAGLVMAAAYEKPKGSKSVYSSHLTRCRQIVGSKLWFLIPGVGTQGGYINETVRVAYVGPGSIAINSSSEICFASAGEDFAEAAAKKAEELRDQINLSL